MSYSSSQTSQISGINKSINIGATRTTSNSNAITLTDGATTQVLEVELPLGIWSGQFSIIYSGDATTNVSRLRLNIVNELGVTILSDSILINKTLPNGANRQYILGITQSLLETDSNKLTFLVEAQYSGTNIDVNAGGVDLNLVKVV
jgi:hypothetical protein